LKSPSVDGLTACGNGQKAELFIGFAAFFQIYGRAIIVGALRAAKLDGNIGPMSVVGEIELSHWHQAELSPKRFARVLSVGRQA
jgi:hypothetical protein